MGPSSPLKLCVVFGFFGIVCCVVTSVFVVLGTSIGTRLRGEFDRRVSVSVSTLTSPKLKDPFQATETKKNLTVAQMLEWRWYPLKADFDSFGKWAATESCALEMNNSTVATYNYTPSLADSISSAHRLDTLANLLIVGAMKCGTTSLYEYLSHHPQVSGVKSKTLLPKKTLGDLNDYIMDKRTYQRLIQEQNEANDKTQVSASDSGRHYKSWLRQLFGSDSIRVNADKKHLRTKDENRQKRMQNRLTEMLKHIHNSQWYEIETVTELKQPFGNALRFEGEIQGMSGLLRPILGSKETRFFDLTKQKYLFALSNYNESLMLQWYNHVFDPKEVDDNGTVLHTALQPAAGNGTAKDSSEVIVAKWQRLFEEYQTAKANVKSDANPQQSEIASAKKMADASSHKRELPHNSDSELPQIIQKSSSSNNVVEDSADGNGVGLASDWPVRYYMEASPTYFSSLASAYLMARYLTQSTLKMIVLLREPVSRVDSMLSMDARWCVDALRKLPPTGDLRLDAMDTDTRKLTCAWHRSVSHCDALWIGFATVFAEARWQRTAQQLANQSLCCGDLREVRKLISIKLRDILGPIRKELLQMRGNKNIDLKKVNKVEVIRGKNEKDGGGGKVKSHWTEEKVFDLVRRGRQNFMAEVKRHVSTGLYAFHLLEFLYAFGVVQTLPKGLSLGEWLRSRQRVNPFEGAFIDSHLDALNADASVRQSIDCFFDRHLLVLSSESFFEEPVSTLRRVEHFLDLEHTLAEERWRLISERKYNMEKSRNRPAVVASKVLPKDSSNEKLSEAHKLLQRLYKTHSGFLRKLLPETIANQFSWL